MGVGEATLGMQQAAPAALLKPDDVRLAVPEDRAQLIALTEMLHGENGLFSLSPRKRDMLIDRYYNRDGSIIGVIGDVGNPVASIYLSLTQPEYTDDWALVEIWNFVKPENRKTEHAKHMIEYAKYVSHQMKLPLIVGVLSNARTEAKMRLYDRMLSRVGGYYIFGIEHTQWGAEK